MICESCKQKDRIISDLQARIEDLEKQVKETNQAVRSLLYKPDRKNKNSKLGPPKGHKAHHRPRPDHVDETISLSLDRCPECDNNLGKVVETKERFIEDIKPAKPHVRRYIIHRYYCTCCTKLVSAKPAEIPYCRFGLNLLVLITFLRYGIHMPMNKIRKQLVICYGLKISEGTITNELTRCANYLGPEFERIKREVRELAALNADETGWRIAGKNKWLWDFIGKQHSLLLIRDTRGRDVIEEVLGNSDPIVTTDCLKTYDIIPYRMQKCWAHLLRDTRKRKNKENRILLDSLKHINRLAKSGDFTKDDMLCMLDSVIGKEFTDAWCVSIVKRVKKFRHEWFTFMEHEDVDDTNNAAERGLRPSVVMRKISGGNRSEKGARNHEIIMSVMQTWDKQGIDFMEYGMEFIRQQLH